MNPVDPTDPPREPVEPDIVGTGVVLAIMWQAGAIALSMPLYFTCWGLIQWFALVPLYISHGVRRHPVQLYESAAMILLALVLSRISPPRLAEGDRFRVFMLSYFGWRLLIDFLKPGVRFGGLTILQWCSVAALLWYARDLRRILLRHAVVKGALANG